MKAGLKKVNVTKLVQQAFIMALYVALNMAMGALSFGTVQVRISTGLYALALGNPSMILPLTLANVISNLSSPFGVIDWGIGAICGVTVTYTLSKMKSKKFILIPIIVFPMIFVSFMLNKMTQAPLQILFMNVGIGQFISGLTGYVFLEVWNQINRLTPKNEITM